MHAAEPLAFPRLARMFDVPSRRRTNARVSTAFLYFFSTAMRNAFFSLCSIDVWSLVSHRYSRSPASVVDKNKNFLVGDALDARSRDNDREGARRNPFADGIISRGRARNRDGELSELQRGYETMASRLDSSTCSSQMNHEPPPSHPLCRPYTFLRALISARWQVPAGRMLA